MRRKKNNLLEKFIKKDFNNELEKILDEKKFNESVKNILLNILYKLEISYKDVKTVKRDVENKDEYIQKLLNNIKNNCDSIKIINMSEKNIIPENRTYLIDKTKKEIISYPIDRKVLYAIEKISKPDTIMKEDYFLINETLSDLINIGNNLDMVEPLRDFNGYSWTCVSNEIESVDHNLIYQNLRIIVSNNFLNKWIQNKEFMIDYYELLNDNLEEKYGLNNKNKFIEVLSKLSILFDVKYDLEKKNKILELKDEVIEESNKVSNSKQYIEDVTKEKTKYIKKIKELDSILKDKNLLKQEYNKRNKSLSLEKKIFSLKVLFNKLKKERKKYLEQIEYLNSIINPNTFIKHKNEINKKYDLLKEIDEFDLDEQIEKLKIEFQKIFLQLFEINIKKAETKQDVEKLIYDLRYYLLLPFDRNCLIKDKQELKQIINKIIQEIIDKAINLKAFEKISEDKNVNHEILRNIFFVRIIKLEDTYLKITSENKKIYIQIFDENMIEEKIEIKKPKDLDIKVNKKIKIMSN